MPPDDAGRPDDTPAPDVEDESFVVEVSPYSTETDVPATNGGLGRAIRWVLVGGIAILGLAIGVGVFIANNSTGDGITAGVVPVTTLGPGSSDDSIATEPSSTLVPSIAPDESVVGGVPLEGGGHTRR